MPHDFRFPTRETLFWTTQRFKEEDYQDRNNNYLEGIGRLKPGVSVAQARSELLLIAARLRRQYPRENESVDLSVVAVRDELSSESRLLLTGLCGAALCVLVIACANLANLLLARSLARQRELSIRLSLGASRRNLLRQLLSESLLLGLGRRRQRNRGGHSSLAAARAFGAQRTSDSASAPRRRTDVTVCSGSDPNYRDRLRCRSRTAGVQRCRFKRASRRRAYRRNRQSPGTICVGDCGTRSIRRAAGLVRIVDSRFVEGAIRRPRIQNEAASCRCVPSCPSPNTTKPALEISSIARC